MTKVDEGEVGYIAAVLDAEGTLSIGCKHGGSSYRPVVGVSQSNYGWLEGMQKLWGGEVYPNHDKRPRNALMWRWYITGDDMVNLLSVVKPYLRLKNEQAELLLELERRIRSFQRLSGAPIPKEELSRRRELYRRCHLLNQKGPRGNQLELPKTSPQLSLVGLPYLDPWDRA